MKAPLVVLLLCVLCHPASATSNLLQTFDDPTPPGRGAFGFSVAIDGANVLLGEASDSTNGAAVGQAHLFDAATGSRLQTFNDPTATGLDFFGFSVAIDASNALVGAFGDDTNGDDVGQAHLFDIATGNLLQTFNDPTVTSRDNFGFSVAIDGSNVLVGAHGDDTNGSGAGQAHLFDVATGNLLQTFDDPTPGINGSFGFSVAINGSNILIGARGDNTSAINAGQAHLFDAATGNLLQTFSNPNASFRGFFGSSVAIDDQNVLVGAPFEGRGGRAYLFDAATGSFLQSFDNPNASFGDEFGSSVAIDGNNVLIGARLEGVGRGDAYLFDATTGDLLQSLNDPAVTFAGGFGSSVAIDGANALVGTQSDNARQAFLFDITVPEPGSGLLLTAGSLLASARRRPSA